MLSPREAALRAAFEAHAASVTRLAHRVLRDEDEARDVCQEAFVRLHDSWDDVRGEPGAWLRAVAWRLALDSLRKRKRLAKGLAERSRELSGAVNERSFMEESERRESVARAMGALTARQRSVVAMRVFDGEAFPEIARALGVSEGSAKVHLRRALERLRPLLAPFLAWERKP